MRSTLTQAEKSALTEIMYRGFVAIRIAGWAGDAAKAAAIADALHNVPHLVSGREGWTLEVLRKDFLRADARHRSRLARFSATLDMARRPCRARSRSRFAI
jgi:hypothetical protein